MMRNDYRRALILLRSNASGFSGHVRLERRTLMGTMYFQLQSPGDCPVLRAALVGRGRDGTYYACNVGEMHRDGRGQAVLGYSFDPRDICGRELEQYQLIVITCAGDSECQVALFGNVCGHAELNWESVRAALCALDTQPRSEAEPVSPLEPVSESTAQPQFGATADEAIPDGGAIGNSLEAASETATDAAPAGEKLGVDMDLPWPEAAEPLRTLFQTHPPLADAPDDQCVYVEAPMPEGSGFPFVAAGLLVLGGALAAIRYALPARWTQEPPEGLEDCAWVGDQNEGWWVSEVPLTD